MKYLKTFEGKYDDITYGEVKGYDSKKIENNMRIKLFEDITDAGDFKPRISKEELLRKDRQNKIDEFDTYFKNLEILKGYIDALNISKEINKVMLSYAIILHNFIILERIYSEEVEQSGYEINKYLNLDSHLSYQEYTINKVLIELYGPSHKVRNNVETINRVKPIGNFLSSNPEMYNRVYTEDEIDMLIQSNKYNI